MTSKKKFSMEKSLQELQDILESLQDQDLDFDKNIDYFRKGTELIHQCRSYLNQSELEIKKLMETTEGVEEEDFE